MAIKKLLLGTALLIFATATSIQSAKAEEWVNKDGTARGFSSEFNYIVESNYNKTYDANQKKVVDEAQEAGGEFRTLSDGQVWASKGDNSVIEVTNGRGIKYPLTKVEIADTNIATVSRKTTGALTQPHNEYTIQTLNYGNTTLKITRENGDSFTVPINVVPSAQIQNDESQNEKNVIMGVGQMIQPVVSVSSGDSYGNKAMYYKWTSDNTTTIEIIKENQVFAKKVGSAIVRCSVFDKLACMNKNYYKKDYTNREVRYAVKVQEDTPVIQLKDGNGELLNQKVITKNVGDTMTLNPSLQEAAWTITWQFYSSNDNVATIDSLGNLTAMGVGTAIIKVKGAEQEQSFTLNVSNAPSGEKVAELEAIHLKIPNNKIILGMGKIILDYYATEPLNTKLYSFTATSDNDEIIEVKNDTLLFAKKVGTCNIIVKAMDYKKDVKEETVSIDVVLDTPMISVKSSKNGNILTISKIESAKSYSIYRSASKNSGYEMIDTVAQNSYTDKTATTGIGYFYKVVANYGDTKYNSDFSNIVTTQPKAPKVKKVKKISKNVFKIKISGVKADGYEVYYGKNKKCKKRVGEGTNKNLAFKLKLKKKKTYYFKVRTIVKIGDTSIKSKFSKAYKFKFKK